jgi:hypothetical protein
MRTGEHYRSDYYMGQIAQAFRPWFRLVETVSYEVVKKLDGVEIRKYPKMIVARVDGYGDGGFNMLFQFISGQNKQKSKVAMTAPVVSEKIAMTAPGLPSEGSIAFVMPESYTPETIPWPTDERIKIVESPPRSLAVLRFSGRWGGKAFEKRTKEMLNDLKKAGIVTRGEAFGMRYNPPFMPWFLRRNEVAIEVIL